MPADKFLVCLFLTLLAGSMLAAHINQGLRVEIAQLEEARLDAAGVIGWVEIDPATMQLCFVRR